MISISQAETKIQGIRVGRPAEQLTEINAASLIQDIVESEADVVRFALDSHLPELYDRLDELCIPYYMPGITLTYRNNLKHWKQLEYRTDVEFEEYFGEPEKEKILYEMSRTTFAEVPGSYFDNPYTSQVITKEQQIETFARYMLTYHNKVDSNKHMMLGKLRGEYVCFITWYWYPGSSTKDGEGTYSGIMPTSRGTALYLDMVRLMHNWPAQHDCVWGHAGAQLQNQAVHKSLVNEGMKLCQTNVNIHINSFWNRSEHPTTEASVNMDGHLHTNVLQLLTGSLQGPATLNRNWCKLLSEPAVGTALHVKLSSPVSTSTKALSLAKLYDSDTLVGFAYADYTPR